MSPNEERKSTLQSLLTISGRAISPRLPPALRPWEKGGVREIAPTVTTTPRRSEVDRLDTLSTCHYHLLNG